LLWRVGSGSFDEKPKWGNAMGEILLSETVGVVRTLTLNRPERLNSLSNALLAALEAAFAEAERDDAVRVVLLTGCGRAFSTGGDLETDIEGTPDLGAIIEAYYNPLVRRMRSMTKPIICAVNGIAAGAGVNLALAADIVVAAREAVFSLAFIRIGLCPDGGGSYFLPRLAGDARARALVMLGETISAETAEQYGLIWKCFDGASLMTEARTIAYNLAASPAAAIAAIKVAFNATWSSNLEQQLGLEADLQRKLGRTSDFAEGVQAFREKRRAVFGG